MTVATENAVQKKASPSMKLMKGVKAKTPVGTTVAEEVEEVVETKQKTKLSNKVGNVEKVDTSDAGTVETDLIVKTAHECENLKEDKAFKLIPQLLDTIDHDYFRLGGVLSMVQAQGWYMDKGFENFRAFVEGDCGMAYRKAMYLIQIYNGLVASGVKWEAVKHLGWTKLKELSAILTTENVGEWVALAEGLTVIQLQEHITKASAGTSEKGVAESKEESKKTTTMTFKLHEDQKATIREALDKVKHETGTDSDTVALEHMSLDYLGGDHKLKSVPTLKDLMTGKSPEEVLEIVGEVFPDLEMSVTVPE